ANYANFAGVYAILRTALVAFLALIFASTIAPLFGVHVAVDSVAWVGTGLLFILLGGLFGKIRPNWFVGIRTPWTLSSKLSWTRTHRAGGWLFITMGVIFMIVGIVRTAWAVRFMLGLGLAGVLGLVIYSYVLWRRDPDKTPPAG